MFTQFSGGGVASGYVAGSSMHQSPHRDDNQFLGLNWRNVVVTIMVGTMAAVVSDLVLYSVHKHYRIKREDY
jgi:hypothetical protein